jgi:hypothetical protein
LTIDNRQLIEARLEGTAEYRPVTAGVELVEQINALAPPDPIKENQIYIRRCRLVGDAVNNQNGRFRTADMPLLLQLTNGAPLMVGHDTYTLPIGKFFGGRLEMVGGVTFIEPNFYWMRAAELAEDLHANIDGGIYREASIGFSFETPTCSICGEDIRSIDKCKHIPGQEYDGAMCFYWYDGLQSVNEGSIVYRGAHAGTGFDKLEGILTTKGTKITKEILDKDKQQIKQIAQIEEEEILDKDKKSGGKGTMETVKLEFLPDVLTALAKTLGCESLADADGLINSAVDLRTKFDSQAVEIKRLEADARFGKGLREATKTGLVALEGLLASFTKSEPREHILAAIEATNDLEKLAKIELGLQAEIDKVAPPLKCAECGSANITRRQSEPDRGVEPKPARRRVVDAGAVRI